MSTKGARSSSKNKGGGGGSKPSTPSRKNSAQSPLVNQRKSLDRSGQRSRVSSIVSDLSDDEDSVVSTSSRGSRGSVRSNQSNQNKGVQSKGGQSKSPSKGPNKLKGAGLAVMATNRRKQRGSRSRASFEMDDPSIQEEDPPMSNKEVDELAATTKQTVFESDLAYIHRLLISNKEFAESFDKHMSAEKQAVATGEKTVPILPETDEQSVAKKKKMEKELQKRKKDEEKRRKEEEARLYGLTLFGSLRKESQEILKMLKITLSPSEPDPAIYLIGHVAKTVSTLIDLIEVLEKEDKSKAILVPKTYVDSMNNGLIDFLVKGLSFQVNFEPDRIVGANYFDAGHVILGALPYLTDTREEKCGQTILHHRAIYESRTPMLVEESIKVVARYGENCCNVKDAEGQLALHAIAQSTSSELELNEAMERLIGISPSATNEPDNKGLIPLHYACDTTRPNGSIINALLEANKKTANIPDNDGNLPIHLACKYNDASLTVITYLTRASGSCLKTENGEMDLPLHTLLRNRSPTFQVVKLLVDNHKGALMQPGGEHGVLPLHLALSHYPPSILNIRFLLDMNREACREADPETQLLPVNMAINLLHIAYTFIADKNEFPVDEEDDEEEWEGGNKRGHKDFKLEYPKIKNVHIYEDPETDHESIASSLETIINRMMDEYDKAAFHTSTIGWTPLHYLVYMRSQPSISLVSMFAKVNSAAIKQTMTHISPLVHLSSDLLPNGDRIKSSMEQKDVENESISLDASSTADNILPALMNKTMSFSELMMTTNNNAAGMLNMKKIDQGRMGDDNDETIKNNFSPLSLAKERGWFQVFTVLKQVSVKVLGDSLKFVIDRGITESAYGSPRLVTPLPKLVPSGKNQNTASQQRLRGNEREEGERGRTNDADTEVVQSKV